jgi:hypothetical protein
MKSAWFRLLVFLILLAPVIALVNKGHASKWVIPFAALGLTMFLFNRVIYMSDAWSRAIQYKDGENIEQSDFGKAGSMGCGVVFWIIALWTAIYYLHHA